MFNTFNITNNLFLNASNKDNANIALNKAESDNTLITIYAIFMIGTVALAGMKSNESKQKAKWYSRIRLIRVMFIVYDIT